MFLLSPCLGTQNLYPTRTIHRESCPFISPSLANLSGKSVLITGTSRGIGRSIALSFARAGASLICITSRHLHDLDNVISAMNDAAKKNRRPEPRVLKFEADVINPTAVRQLAQTIEAIFTILDILINNARILGKFDPIVDSDVDEWWKVLEVNIKGTYLVTRAMLPSMVKSSPRGDVQGNTEGGKGIVVNVSSAGVNNREFEGSSFTVRLDIHSLICLISYLRFRPAN